VSSLLKSSFISENTKFSNVSNATSGFLLEFPYWGTNIWHTSSSINLGYSSASTSYYYGVQPVIEVLKKDIKI